MVDSECSVSVPVGLTKWLNIFQLYREVAMYGLRNVWFTEMWPESQQHATKWVHVFEQLYNLTELWDYSRTNGETPCCLLKGYTWPVRRVLISREHGPNPMTKCTKYVTWRLWGGGLGQPLNAWLRYYISLFNMYIISCPCLNPDTI